MNYSDELEVTTSLLLPINYVRQDDDDRVIPSMLNLKMKVSAGKMQQYLTSNKVYTTSGILSLNNISKPVAVQYTCFPLGTDDEGKMRITLIMTFHLADFFPDPIENVAIAFVIHNSYVNNL
jgi:hypothetical protein